MRIATLAAFVLATAASAGQVPDDRVDGSSPLHLAVVLAPRDMDALRALLLRQRDPQSPDFRRFLTPSTFGSRFGQPEQRYDEVSEWLTGAGFRVERSPNRLYLGATGTAAQAETLLGVQLQSATDERGRRFRHPSKPPTIPPSFFPFVLAIDGLDTRPRLHPRLLDSSGNQDLGPQDLRRFYDINSLLARGITGKGAQLAVLGPQVPQATCPRRTIAFFLENLSNATAPVVFDVLPNPAKELDNQPGWHQELESDVELQTVAAPEATSITLVLAPSYEVYSTGVNEIVSNLSQVTAVSLPSGSANRRPWPRTEGRPSQTWKRSSARASPRDRPGLPRLEIPARTTAATGAARRWTSPAAFPRSLRLEARRHPWSSTPTKP